MEDENVKQEENVEKKTEELEASEPVIEKRKPPVLGLIILGILIAIFGLILFFYPTLLQFIIVFVI